MEIPVFAGVKNVSGGKLKQKYGGILHSFDKDEVKILPSDAILFFTTRSKYIAAAEGQKGLSMQMLFKAVPLQEALKLAKEPENPSVAAAKEQARIEEKNRGEIRAEILKTLKEEGWQAPGKQSKVGGL